MAEPGDDVRARSGGLDPEVLAGLRGRRRVLPGVLAPLWAALAVGQLTQGQVWVAVANVLLALGWAGTWWVSPQPHVRAVTADALLVRNGLRTRTVGRDDLVDVQPHYGYGVVLTLRDAKPLRLADTAPRFSVAAAQAAALRRWAGLDAPAT